MTDQPSTLDEAMAIFQANLPSITKDEKATVKSDKGNYSYGYAGLDTVSEKVLRELGKLGVSWRCRPTVEDGKFVLAYRLKHVNEGEETGVWPLSGGTPQQIGSAITYARRYALMAVTGVFPSNEDDDGAAASGASQDDVWEAAKPATEAQAKLFDTFLTQIKACENPQQIKNAGQLIKDARGNRRITYAQYDQLDIAAGRQLAELKQETPA